MVDTLQTKIGAILNGADVSMWVQAVSIHIILVCEFIMKITMSDTNTHA